MITLGTGTQRAAKGSRVQVGGTFLTFASFEATETGAEVPTTNFNSYNEGRAESFAEGIMGILSSDFKFGGLWDAGFRPTQNPPGLYPRDDLGSVNLMTHRTEGTVWSYPLARIRGVTNSAEVEGGVAFNVTDAKNQGPFTRP